MDIPEGAVYDSNPDPMAIDEDEPLAYVQAEFTVGKEESNLSVENVGLYKSNKVKHHKSVTMSGKSVNRSYSPRSCSSMATLKIPLPKTSMQLPEDATLEPKKQETTVHEFRNRMQGLGVLGYILGFLGFLGFGCFGFTDLL